MNLKYNSKWTDKSTCWTKPELTIAKRLEILHIGHGETLGQL